MATIFKFDEVKKLKSKSLPYEQYFGEMDLTDSQKKERISLAKELEKVFLFVFSMMKAEVVLGKELDKEYYSEMLSRRYEDTLITLGILDAVSSDRDKYQKNMEKYVDDISKIIIATTIDSKTDPYMYSEDRQKFSSENESNTIYNSKDYSNAVQDGYKRKQWITMKDSHVRKSHTYVDDEIIGIHDLFEVGNSKMLYPRHSAGSSEEIVGCRCSIRYLK